LERGVKNATFLPQVWNELPGKEEFLSELAIKADLPKMIGKNPELRLASMKWRQ